MNTLMKIKLPKLESSVAPLNSKDNDVNRTRIDPVKVSHSSSETIGRYSPIIEGPRSYKAVWLRLKTKVMAQIYLKKLLRNIKLLGPSTTKIRDINLDDDNFLAAMHAKGINIADIATSPQAFPQGVFDPAGKFLAFWNLTMLMILLYVATISPFRLSFYDEQIWDSFFTADVVIDFFFILDVIITFNSAYYDFESQLFTSRNAIAWNYAKGWLVLDLFSSTPITLIEASAFNTSHNQSRLMRLSKIPKLLRLSRLMKMMKNFSYFENFDFLIGINQRTVRFAKVITGIGLSVHIVACFWHVTASLDNLSPNTWVYRYGYLDASAGERYLACVYWAVTTFTTVGYGDISAYTESEKILAMIWMIMAVYFISFSIGSLSSMLSQNYTKHKIINNKLALADEYMKLNQLSISVLQKMKRSIRTYTDFTSFTSENRAELLDKLPLKLRYEIALDMYGGIISRFPFFSVRDEGFVGSVVPYLDYSTYHKYQIIWSAGEPANCIYFIAKGQVNYTYGPKNIGFKSLTVGHYFGDTEIFRDKIRIFSVNSGALTNLLIMDQNLIDKIEKTFPKVWEDIQKVTKERERKLLLSYAETKVMQQAGGSVETRNSVELVKEKVLQEFEAISANLVSQNATENVTRMLDRISKDMRMQSEAIQRIQDHLGISTSHS